MQSGGHPIPVQAAHAALLEQRCTQPPLVTPVPLWNSTTTHASLSGTSCRMEQTDCGQVDQLASNRRIESAT